MSPEEVKLKFHCNILERADEVPKWDSVSKRDVTYPRSVRSVKRYVGEMFILSYFIMKLISEVMLELKF